MKFYVGTMNRPATLADFPHAQGIYECEFHPEDGSFGTYKLAAKLESPTFLALHPDLNVLYAASSNLQNSDEDLLTAYKIDTNTGALTCVSECSSYGKNPCHLMVHPSRNRLFAPNYSSGNAAVVKLSPDGTFQSAKEPNNIQILTFENHCVGTGRQEASHPHCFTAACDGRFVVCCDLGCDRIYTFQNIEQNSTSGDFYVSSFADAPSGTGPRHAVFSRFFNRLYVFNELSCTLSAYNFNPESGSLVLCRTFPVLPPTRPNEKPSVGQGAEIVLHPSGRFLYVSSRISNTLTLFEEVETDEYLRPIQHLSAGGEIPRHITFDPSGNWLLAVCQKTGRIFSFFVHNSDGILTPSNHSVPAPWCACAVFPESVSCGH